MQEGKTAFLKIVSNITNDQLFYSFYAHTSGSHYFYIFKTADYKYPCTLLSDASTIFRFPKEYASIKCSIFVIILCNFYRYLFKTHSC